MKTTMVFLSLVLGGGFCWAGNLSGTVEVVKTDPKKVAQRYPGGSSTEAQNLQSPPTVVFVSGVISGAPPKSAVPGAAIVQKDLLFEPNFLIVPVGSSVKFPNEDDDFHNVFSYSKARRFDLGRYRNGESKTVEFDKPGIIKVYCEIHPWMRAAILVVENPFYAEVGEDGRYSIDGIPPGSYEVVVWNIEAGSEKFQLTIASSGATEADLKLTSNATPAISEEPLELAELRSLNPDAGSPDCCATGASD